MSTNNQNATIAAVPSSAVSAANSITLTILSTTTSTMSSSPTPSDLILDPSDTESSLGVPSSTPSAGVSSASSSAAIPVPTTSQEAAPPVAPPPPVATSTQPATTSPTTTVPLSTMQSSTSSSPQTIDMNSTSPTATASPTQSNSISTDTSPASSVVPSSGPESSSISTNTAPTPSTAPSSLPSSPNSSSSSVLKTGIISSTSPSAIDSTSGLLSSSSSSAAATTDAFLPASSTLQETLAGPSSAQTEPSNGSSPNVAMIAAPVAVGAVLVTVFVLFFCWWKRRRPFRGGYRYRNRSNDTEMSRFSADAMEASHEPKGLSNNTEMIESSARNQPSTSAEQQKLTTWPVESTFAPGVLPGLVPRSLSGASLISPPPYRKKDRRADSPTVPLDGAIEPFDAAGIPNIAGPPARKQVSSQRQPTSKRNAPDNLEDITWPLPSHLSVNSLEEGLRALPLLASRPDSSKADSSIYVPSESMPSDRGERVAGPSNAWPLTSSAQRQISASESQRKLSAQSPFDDENANDSASEYSVSAQGDRCQSAMLSVPEGRQVNDDGISAMSVSTRDSNRRSRLNHRASDEMSIVSALNETDEIASMHEAQVSSRALAS